MPIYESPVYESAPIYSAPYEAPVEGGESVIDPAPANGVDPVPVPEPDAAVEARLQDDAAVLTVAVPEGAKVYVNDRLTSSEGMIRQYLSTGLKAGYSYTYVVRVEQTVDGEVLVKSQEVRLRAGAMERLVFDMPASDVQIAAEKQETKLTLMVPEDAKVTLAGNPTAVEGSTRTFRTQQLAAGQAWENYTIRVSVNRNGREMTKEQTIRLLAGADESLAFQFDDVELASR